MIDLDISALGRDAARMIDALGGITAEPGRMTRLYLTPEHKRANALLMRWMGEAGLEVAEDALGSVRGRLPGRERDNGPRLIIGSHIDTVVDGGLYDGNLGVVAGVLALRRLVEAGVRPKVGVDLYAFGEEEGVRFPTTYASSRGVAGTFERAWLESTDREGVSLSEALADFGTEAGTIETAAYGPPGALAYLEVHIEQGPVLEMERQPLGVVTAIVGQSRLTLTVLGEAGHAGTVPMRLRRDAYAAAAEMALALERIARARPDAVATMGRILVEPGAVNVIPSKVVCSVDIRSPSDAERQEIVDAFRAAVRSIAGDRNVAATLSLYSASATTPCAGFLQDAIATAITGLGGWPVHLPSGAGHDAQAMAALCPVGMMFVRCRNGLSHHPDEYCAPEDMGIATAALIRIIEKFDTPPF